MSKERYLEQEINKDLRILELKRQLAEAMSMLDNVWYWDGCPDDYKKRIEQLKEQGDE